MKLSPTYKLMTFLGLYFSEEEYGQVSLWKVIKKTFLHIKNAFLLRHCLHLFIFAPINARFVRPKVWRWIGCSVGKHVFIGAQVSPDITNANLIILEDKVHIASHCIILCHQRDLRNYYIGGDYSKLPYTRKKVHLKQGCLIGTNSILMPGVTVGEGAIVGANSLVVKDIPAWTIAIGQPAKVVKELKSN